MDVGFVGIGSMGAAMVPNLVKAGHRIEVWNRDPAAAKARDGVTVLMSPAAAFQNDAIVTMLSDDAAVRAVIINEGVLASARKGCVHVMMATISLALVEELKGLHRQAGIAYVAAPVFGPVFEVPAVPAKALLNIMACASCACAARMQGNGWLSSAEMGMQVA